MEGEKKSNTAMLTVIAIATLLVAVVGATFAYFSASTTNTGKVTVSAETKAADIFSATGDGAVALTVNASDMQSTNGSDSYSAYVDGTSTPNLVISLEAGSGNATCTYNLTYTPKAASVDPKIDTYELSAHAAAADPDLKEFTIQGSDGTQNVAEQNLVGTIDLDGNQSKYTITDAAGNGATTQNWTFTPRFYNLAGDQSELANKHFEGVITVTDVVCTNSATQP